MPLESFSALDFETATWNPASICQIGIVRVVDGEVVEKVDRLVQPPRNEYFYKNIEVHGIQPEDTMDAPLFENVWFDIKHLIEDEVVVAHNANFDVNCLRNTLAYYDITQPDFEVRCTRVIYRRGLAYLSKKYKIELQHHNALSDANACAQLYLKHLKRQALPKTGSLF
ncbi:3'-5' exonuclease [Ekhidna sp.]|uniref:3'-5' exonuclease n=1 Tax=Ekhidna sp. TaxID=2608089 RepID=UPI003511D54F